MPSTFGNLPQSQLDALPGFGSDAATSGGSGSFNPGGGITRVWTPADTGINGINFGLDANGFTILASSFLNVTGCRAFLAILTRTSTAGVLAAHAATIAWIQYRLNSTDVPPTSFGATQPTGYLGLVTIGDNLTIQFPAQNAAADVQRAAIGFCDYVLASVATPAGVPVAAGNDVRFLFTTGAAVIANESYSLWLWGKS
jgi:hypothetical protein